MKRPNLIFTALLVPVDFLMLVLAGAAAYFLRTSDLVSQLRPVLFNIDLPFEKYFATVLIVAILWIVVFALSGLYKIKRSNRLVEEFFQIVIASSAGLMAIIIYIFIRGEFFNSRFIILAAWLLAILFVFLGRLFIRKIQEYLIVYHNLGAQRVLVVGNGKVTNNLVNEIKSSPESGLRVIEKISDLNMEQIENAIEEKQIDQVLLGEINNSVEERMKLIDFCQEKRIDFKFVPTLLQAATSNIEIDTLAGVPIIELKRTALGGWGRIIKRTLDMIFSIFFLILFSPIMLLVALAIKLGSEGPVIYKNLRVGPKKNFKVYKFRSFYLKYCIGEEYPFNKEANEFEDKLARERSLRKGPVFKVGNDPRRTRAGRFLERWSLDELPQFFNVLKGEMSLVGPRPHMPSQVANYQKHHMKVFNIKPGITGLGQISGRSDLEFDEEAKLDIYYIENWSLGLDFKIMLKTPFVALFGKHKS